MKFCSKAVCFFGYKPAARAGSAFCSAAIPGSGGEQYFFQKKKSGRFISRFLCPLPAPRAESTALARIKRMRDEIVRI